MRRLGIGLREVVALGMLVVALVVALAFFDPSSTDGTPPVRETPTAVTRPSAAGLGTWQVTYFEGTAPSVVVVGRGEHETLSLTYEAGAFPDVKDDAWGMTAVAKFSGPAGRYLLELDWSGEIGLLLNEEERRITPSVGPGSIVIPFEQVQGETTTIRLTLRDSGGPAAIAARVTQ